MDAAQTRHFALIALGVLLLEEATKVLEIRFGRDTPLLQEGREMAFYWVITFLVVCWVEKRSFRSLGLLVSRRHVVAFVVLAACFLVLPAFFAEVDGKALLIEFVEQMAYIGLAEEVFFRGYLMSRLCVWLGDRRGLVFSAILFGLVHVVSLVAFHGLRSALRDSLTGLGAALGGLLYGWLLLKTSSIVPGAVIHTAANLYLYVFLAA
jgi:membrane protease YdiL (CAAX protease family)